MQPIRRLILAAIFVAGSMAPALAAPKVVTSILAVHSLASSVMTGVGTPDLLISGDTSPHRFALRPSQRKALAEADLIFWVGENIEGSLAKVISLSRARGVALMRAPDVIRLKARSGGVWGEGDHGHDHGHGHGHKDDHSKKEDVEIDAHIWLDPANARAIVKTMVAELCKVDPANQARYKTNGEAALARLNRLEKELGAKLAPVRKRPYIVFHDAFQYFERRFGMAAAGSLLVHTGHAPSAKRMFQIRKKILARNVKCVFREPQFDAKLADSVVRGTPARIATLDPVGSGLKSGPGAYDALIRNIATSMIGCLGQG